MSGLSGGAPVADRWIKSPRERLGIWIQRRVYVDEQALGRPEV